jgi:hypothetical protein
VSGWDIFGDLLGRLRYPKIEYLGDCAWRASCISTVNVQASALGPDPLTAVIRLALEVGVLKEVMIKRWLRRGCFHESASYTH